MRNPGIPPRHRKPALEAQFDLPMLAKDLSAKDYISAIKATHWNNDYQTEVFKDFLETDSIDDIVFSDHRCSIANSLVIRHVLPEFIESKGLKVERVVGVESDGEYPPSFSSIEVSSDETVSRLVYGNYFLSDETHKYMIRCEAGYQDDYTFKVASRKDLTPDANAFMEELLKYGEEHNFLIGKKIDPNCRFIKFDKKYTWDDLILPSGIKEKIRQNLTNLISSREIYKSNGLQIKRGIVLSGEPGTGKTFLFKVLCNQIDWTVVWVTPKHLENAKKVSQIVTLCKDLAPTIMLLEDLDLYAGERSSNHNPALLGEMMNQLDGVQENTDIITIATTNNKEVLEKALLDRPGRFDICIDFPLPEYNERLQMLKVFSNGLVNETLPFFDIVAKEHTKGMTGAKVRELINMAIIFVVDEKSYDENQKLTLTEAHFKHALKATESKDFTKGLGFNPSGPSSSLGSRLLDEMGLDD